MIVLINLLGFVLIGLIVWWFWLYKPREQAALANRKGLIEIRVENGIYTPATIHAKLGQELTLRFLRLDKTPCSATVLFPDFEISEELPIEESFDIKLLPKIAGEFEFTCQMAMYRGRLIID